MHIASATFTQSSPKLSLCPSDHRPEFAFIGRSNVGKSSLINLLTDRPGLAKVSASPGKTRLINHFLINEVWYLVDLPGYGYARVSKSERGAFSKLITDYVLHREEMIVLFVLIDVRHEPQRLDLEFIQLLGEKGVPFALIFTKGDKVSSNEAASHMARYRRTLRASWEELPPMWLTSSEKRSGRDDVLDFIDQCLQTLPPPSNP
ncbi:MAG: ribosome biogenesis GTP-binding protein YihA/YsxC [Alistipes sp.]|nr:ribosome biogenesis GTP-binding protein YihA/YsxC [Alistipes sp.]